MSEYRRFVYPGGTWFFTVNFTERRGNTLLVDCIAELRAAFNLVKRRHPFSVDAVAILPEHLHCIWTLPPGDSGFGTR